NRRHERNGRSVDRGPRPGTGSRAVTSCDGPGRLLLEVLLRHCPDRPGGRESARHAGPRNGVVLRADAGWPRDRRAAHRAAVRSRRRTPRTRDWRRLDDRLRHLATDPAAAALAPSDRHGRIGSLTTALLPTGRGLRRHTAGQITTPRITVLNHGMRRESARAIRVVARC